MEPQDNANREPARPDSTASKASAPIYLDPAGTLAGELRASEKSRRLDLAIERVLRAHRLSEDDDQGGVRLTS
jgi:hypothetical protein